jgi:hypothetical protein
MSVVEFHAIIDDLLGPMVDLVNYIVTLVFGHSGFVRFIVSETLSYFRKSMLCIKTPWEKNLRTVKLIVIYLHHIPFYYVCVYIYI